jgi:hypothetical protein
VYKRRAASRSTKNVEISILEENVHVSTKVRPIYESFLAKHASCMEAGPGGGGAMC